MSGIISKDALAACPAGTTPTEDFDKTDIECPPRDHSKEQKAIQKALGPTPTSRDGIPTPKSLGIRPVVVSSLIIDRALCADILSYRMHLTLSQISTLQTVEPWEQTHCIGCDRACLGVSGSRSFWIS